MMIIPFLALLGLANAAVIPRHDGIKIVIGNDDGWATANIRQFYDTLNQSGHKTLISAPVYNRSGTGSLQFWPIPLLTSGQFDTIPAGAPGTGSDQNDPNICYVNSFPATAIQYGINEFAPKRLGGKPDLAVTGINVGMNLGLINEFSGTVGAASEAIRLGVPAIAFSGLGGTQHVYTESDPVADVYAAVATKLVNAVIAAGVPYLPEGIGLNVNLPKADANTCTRVEDYKYVLSRINFDINPWTPDVTHCNTHHLPTEATVVDTEGCYVSVSVFKGWSKLDVDKDAQRIVKNKLSDLLTCLP